jgi:hypothetical protein
MRSLLTGDTSVKEMFFAIFGISQPAVSRAVERGEKLADEEGFRFLDDEEAKTPGIQTD